jgi:catechol 2,3-dioxygenase-like lactoylglutathione lyase family enzyme
MHHGLTSAPHPAGRGIISLIPMRFLILLSLIALPLAGQVAAPNGAGVSMGHLHIVTANAEAHKKLWIGGLGGKLVHAGPLEYVLFPDVLVGLRPGEPKGGTDGSIVNHLGFLVRDLAATRSALIAGGAEIVREMPETRQMFAMFPDGVRIEFTEDASLPIPIRHHHIHFATPQIEEMRAWYAKVFDAVPGMRSRFKAADLPGVNLSWNPADQATLPTEGRALDHIGFEVKNLKAFCAKLEAQGIRFDTPLTPRPDLGLTVAFLTDPWGTRIELSEGLSKF